MRNQLPKGLEPEDLAMDAIDKVYAGERKWDPQKDPNLLNYLKSVVKSLISNHFRSEEVRIKGGEYSSETPLLGHDNIEEEMYYQQLDQEIAAAMEGDPELCLVYKALKEGYKPGEIAEEYAMEVKKIRNAQKRLHRVVLKIINILSKEITNAKK
ncbi:sigma-70 family RNA polymerase sigma factor [Litoribacter ruber]|nr:sigma-70 family RNA polymerase sigma factor [Litoribacter ruber]